jgi:LuxR family transcriptional regulator
MEKALQPSFENECERIDRLVPDGAVVALGMSMYGPEFIHNTYDPSWIKRYEERSYYFSDPALGWALSNSGHRRWSEVKLEDREGVMAEAATFGLKYGAVFGRVSGMKRSFMGVCRGDREFTDEELAELGEEFLRLTGLFLECANLTAGELDVLRGLRDGLAQKEISQQLEIAESTVKQRIQKACKKLNATTRAQAVGTAVRWGYL